MCDPVSGALVSGGIGLFEGNKNRKAAKGAQKKADALGQQQLALAREQFEYDKATRDEERGYQRTFAEGERDYARGGSEEDYGRKVGLTQRMYDEADLSDADYERAAGQAGNTVAGDFDTGRGITERNAFRYGINPASGKFASLQRGLEASRAIAVANAKNNARSALDIYERGARADALKSGLSISRLIPGSGAAPILNVPNNPAINVLGGLSTQAGSRASDYASASNSAISSGLNTAGQLIGYGFRQNTGSTVTQPAANTGSTLDYNFRPEDLNLSI